MFKNFGKKKTVTLLCLTVLAIAGVFIYASSVGARYSTVLPMYARLNLTAPRYTVNFNLNLPEGADGEEAGTMLSQEYVYGQDPVPLKTNTYTVKTEDGQEYLFLGWAETADGDIKYKDSEPVKNITKKDGETVELYAVWGLVSLRNPDDPTKPLDTKTFTYGDEGEMKPEVVIIVANKSTPDEEVTLPADQFEVLVENNENAGNKDDTYPPTVTVTAENGKKQTYYFEIEPAVLTVTANDVTIYCDEPLPTLEVTYDGFVGDDTAAKSLAGEPSMTCKYTLNDETNGLVGIYDIEIKQGTLTNRGSKEKDNGKNYTFDFVGGKATVQDFPILAEGDTWYKGIVTKSEIKSIIFMDSYTPDGTETDSWDASAGGNGSVKGYIKGTTVIIAGNGYGAHNEEEDGIIFANANSANAFAGFSGLESITNFAMLETENDPVIPNINFNKTGPVTDVSGMFAGDVKLQSIDLSSFDTSAVTDFSHMFDGCAALTDLDLSGFDTSAAIDISYMFKGCASLDELDVTGFNTENVADMSGLFENLKALEELDLSSFKTDSDVLMADIFTGCDALYKITLGEDFYFSTKNGTNPYLPTPESGTGHITAPDGYTVDGRWYTDTSDQFVGYQCNDIPNNKAETYYAYGRNPYTTSDFSIIESGVSQDAYGQMTVDNVNPSSGNSYIVDTGIENIPKKARIQLESGKLNPDYNVYLFLEVCDTLPKEVFTWTLDSCWTIIPGLTGDNGGQIYYYVRDGKKNFSESDLLGYAESGLKIISDDQVHVVKASNVETADLAAYKGYFHGLNSAVSLKFYSYIAQAAANGYASAVNQAKEVFQNTFS